MFVEWINEYISHPLSLIGALIGVRRESYRSTGEAPHLPGSQGRLCEKDPQLCTWQAARRKESSFVLSSSADMSPMPSHWDHACFNALLPPSRKSFWNMETCVFMLPGALHLGTRQGREDEPVWRHGDRGALERSHRESGMQLQSGSAPPSQTLTTEQWLFSPRASWPIYHV